MNLISLPLWLCYILSTIGKSGLCVDLEVKECLKKVCKNVNLSDSVVILRPEQIEGKTLVHFNDSDTRSNLADLYWKKNSTKFSFGLVSGGNQAVGGLIEYDSMPSTSGNKDSSYDCSIAFHDDKLKVFIDGFPSAAWNLSSLDAISEESKTKMSEKVDLDFTSISKLDEGIYISGRCLEGYRINLTDKKCLICSKEETSYGTGTVCSAAASCPKAVTQTPYGEFTWPATLVSKTPQELPCKYDDGLKARRVCSANNSWSAVDTSECVKTKLTEKLQKILDSTSDKETTSHELVELQHIENSKSLGKRDILLTYDILNKVTGRGQGEVSYSVAAAVVDTLTFISKSESCNDNPSCFWMIELIRGVVPRLENRTVLVLSDNVGLFYLEDQLAVLDMYQFCRNTFHDMITGCKNDRLSFLKVMKNELDRLLDGSKRNNVTLSIIFLNSNTYFPATEILSENHFNEILQRYMSYKEEPQEKIQTIASMVVDLEVDGLSNSTETNVFFDLYSHAVYKSRDRMFSAMLNGSKSTYQIEYVCVHYQTNTTRNNYTTERGVVWEEDKSLISKDGLVDLKAMLKNNSRLGMWRSEGCETTYDKFSDNPTIRCTCQGTAGAFTVLSRITRKEFPEYYVEIIISLTGICIVGIAMGLIIIFIPAKWMGIPKAAKINVAVIMVLLLVALYFMIRKMAHEFGRFVF